MKTYDEILQVPEVETVHGAVATSIPAAATVLASPGLALLSSARTCSVPGTLGTTVHILEVAVVPSMGSDKLPFSLPLTGSTFRQGI
ncbi:hypothetical protein EK904_012281 [Melospiza melodia maxima]|nr:hypothetical protein EK904_012281 [Melospiza melodia maxima]